MRINMSNVIDRSEFLTSFSLTRQYSLHLGGGRYTNHKETKTARGVVTQASGVMLVSLIMVKLFQELLGFILANA